MTKLWALEDLDTNVETLGSPAELEIPSETLEAALVEVEGTDAKIDELEGDGVELEADTENLEAMQEIVSDSIEEGGMDETAARAVEVATESYCAKWGIKRKTIALENYGSSATRLQSTKVALEGIGDALKSMWDTFITWLQNMYEAAKDKYLEYFNAGKAIQKRAEKLQARYDDLTGTVKSGWKVPEGIARSLVIAGAVDVAGVMDLCMQAPTTLDAISREMKTEFVADAAKIKNSKFFEETTPPFSAELKFGKKTTVKLAGLVPNGVTKSTISALPGGAYVMVWEKDTVPGGAFQTNVDKVKKLDVPAGFTVPACIKSLEAVGGALETKLKGYKDANEAMNGLKEVLKEAKDKEIDGDSAPADRIKETAARSKAIKHAKGKIAVLKIKEKAILYGCKTAAKGLAGLCDAYMSAHKSA